MWADSIHSTEGPSRAREFTLCLSRHLLALDITAPGGTGHHCSWVFFFNFQTLKTRIDGTAPRIVRPFNLQTQESWYYKWQEITRFSWPSQLCEPIPTVNVLFGLTSPITARCMSYWFLFVTGLLWDSFPMECGVDLRAYLWQKEFTGCHLQNYVTKIWNFISLTLSSTLSLAHADGEALWQAPEWGLSPAAHQELGPSRQRPMGMSPDKHHVSELGSRSLHTWARLPAAFEKLKARGPSQTLHPKKTIKSVALGEQLAAQP